MKKWDKFVVFYRQKKMLCSLEELSNLAREIKTNSLA